MSVAVFAGSFDPVTLGHLNVIERAAALFDRLYVCTTPNGEKHGMFTPQQRLDMLRLSTAHLPNVTAEEWPGLLTDYFKARGANVLVRGVRSATAFDAEYALAQIYRSTCPDFEMVLLPADPSLMHVSSTYAREMIKYKQPLSLCLPAAAAEYIERMG